MILVEGFDITQRVDSILNPDHPYEKIKKILKQSGYKEQKMGDIYINGEISNAYYNDSGEVIYIKYNMCEDDEILDEI